MSLVGDACNDDTIDLYNGSVTGLWDASPRILITKKQKQNKKRWRRIYHANPIAIVERKNGDWRTTLLSQSEPCSMQIMHLQDIPTRSPRTLAISAYVLKNPSHQTFSGIASVGCTPRTSVPFTCAMAVNRLRTSSWSQLSSSPMCSLLSEQDWMDPRRLHMLLPVWYLLQGEILSPLPHLRFGTLACGAYWRRRGMLRRCGAVA